MEGRRLAGRRSFHGQLLALACPSGRGNQGQPSKPWPHRRITWEVDGPAVSLPRGLVELVWNVTQASKYLKTFRLCLRGSRG